ncbi:MAG: peptide ABC transporter substrate-binding protein [Candidatus Latescibacteria bacterium]|jgi:oligopeptide transport system substrate-binding protein|nr:peptide ABC transporter substrate-binding protein [Candidatus Latescibacterota bacterium]
MTVWGKIGVASVAALAVGFTHGVMSQTNQYTNSVGRVLPPDAAPPSQQILRMMSPEPRSLDISINLYDGESTILPFEPLLTRDSNWQPIPAAAERYSVSEDGRIWTFHLRPGARWSDGRPVTAQDFVFGYQRMLDPQVANPYAFFYYDIKNAKEVSQGTIQDLNQLGIRALDDLTVVIETTEATPHLPHIVSFSLAYPAPKWAIEKHGKKWTEVENIVSNSPFRLNEWSYGSHMSFTPDPFYNGPHKPYLEEVVHPFREAGNATVLSYENNEVDVETVDIADLDRIEADPRLKPDLIKSPGRTTWYLFFRTKEAPFNDIRVREAFSRVINREAICRVVLRGSAVPAYSMIPPDFIEYNGQAMKQYQSYDPVRAKALMREAGFPNGRGFPKLEMWIRSPSPSMKLAGVAIQQMLKEHLGIDATVRSADRSAYMSRLMDWDMPFGFLRFVADYVDPRNMLDMTWHSQPKGAARHDWQVESFDLLVEEAASELDKARRVKLYQEADEILVKDYGAAFVFHPLTLGLRKQWIKGYERNSDGTVGALSYTDVYIGNNVAR